MPPFGPVRRAELVRALWSLRFDGPYSGGKHQFMVKGARPLRQAGVDREDWERI